MGFRKESSPDTKWRERRRGVRMNSQVKIVLDWESNGLKIHEEATTRVVSPYGCMVVLTHNLPMDHPLQVTNQANEQKAPGLIVWKGPERAEGWEHGIELQGPEMDFWGLEL